MTFSYKRGTPEHVHARVLREADQRLALAVLQVRWVAGQQSGRSVARLRNGDMPASGQTARRHGVFPPRLQGYLVHKEPYSRHIYITHSGPRGGARLLMK